MMSMTSMMLDAAGCALEHLGATVAPSTTQSLDL